MRKKFYILLFLIPLVNILAQRTITVDGNPSDWIGLPPITVHSTTTSEGEFIYLGEINDERTDYDGTQPSSNNDLTEFRVGHDGTWLYLLIKMDDITDINHPHVCLVFTNGSSNQSFIGDDSRRNNCNGCEATVLGSSSQYGRLVDIHTSTSGNPVIELFDGGIWYAPPTSGWQVAISSTNEAIEAKINLADLGLTASSVTRISLMTAPNRVGWNNDIDATAWNEDFQTNGVDVMTPGASSGNAWFRDLSDDDVDFSVEVNLAEAPLPVRLISFNAIVKNNSVFLKWSTITELNNLGFEIEKSISSLKPMWKPIGFVSGYGNSSSIKEYSFQDKDVSNGKYLYRIKQIDNDGSYTYSDVIEIEIKFKPEEFSLKNYPNPLNPTTIIQFDIAKSGNYKINLYTIRGEKVRELLNDYFDEGSYRFEFNGSELASGIYITTLEGERIYLRNKMIVLK